MSKDPRAEALMAKFVNYIMLDWKKSLAIQLMNETFEEIKSKGQKDPEAIFMKAMENVSSKMDTWICKK